MKEVVLKRVVFLKEDELRDVVKEYVKELKNIGVVGNSSGQEWKTLLCGLWSGLVHGNRVDRIVIDVRGSRIEVNDCFAFVRVVEWLFGGVGEVIKED